ncbi:MAG TPA: aminotransferase class I/II-fold pyridoxal phosphate-dependent enzyme [Steroidobacteraceae bacterium]|jgi:cystathionine beta-lyase/cystathionine gamma-synthase|nr:aminotransferase class I/II-fold pyridoxal phosphate-dependent enzyme [Steroidobacteraceae bacterium]
MKDNTFVNHPPAADLPADNRPLVAPIYQSVKFSFDDTAETLRYLRGGRAGFYYSRSSNPTLRQLELTLAQLQGREECLLVGSGVATIAAALLALCKQGDHLLGFIESYGPTRYLVQHLMARYGVTHDLVSIEDRAAIERVLSGTPTRLVLFESPTNPVTKIADIEHLVTHARRNGCLTVMDNTFAGFHNHGSFDIDIFLHSLTKYASGHGDVMGGAVIGRRELIDAMRKDIVSLGPTLDPHAAFLIQRGMRTYFLRYQRQCANALTVSRFLDEHPRVKRVFHPGLESHPQHALAQRQMKDFGAVVSFDLDGGSREGSRFADSLELFSITSSLGSTESLVLPSPLLGGQEYTAEQRAASSIGPATVRLSIGIEEPEDLIADLSQALERAFAGA